MRLETKGSPDSMDGHPAHTGGCRHRARAPVRGAAGRVFERAHDHLLHLCIGDLARRPRAAAHHGGGCRLTVFANTLKHILAHVAVMTASPSEMRVNAIEGGISFSPSQWQKPSKSLDFLRTDFLYLF
jgi:hypothetical protein